MTLSSPILEDISKVTGEHPPEDPSKLSVYLRRICKNTKATEFNNFKPVTQEYLKLTMKAVKAKRALPFPPDLKGHKGPEDDEDDDEYDEESEDDEEAEGSSAVLESLPFDFECTTKQITYDCESALNKLKKNSIVIPEWQRDHVWLPKKRSAFLESFLSGLPITSIFIAYDPQGKKKGKLIDGCQRLLTLQSFVDGNETAFGTKFKNMSDDLKDTFFRRELQIAEVYSEERFHPLIFRKININASPLNDIELKRATFLENNMLIDLEEFHREHQIWRGLFGVGPVERYKGLAALVRATAMHFFYQEYTKGMAPFTDNFLSEYQSHIADNLYGTDYVTNLDKIMNALNEFSDTLDPDPILKKKKKKLTFRVTTKSQINLGLIDCLVHAGMYALQQDSKLSKAKLADVLKGVRESLLSSKDDVKSLTKDTSGRGPVIHRMSKVEEYVTNLLR